MQQRLSLLAVAIASFAAVARPQSEPPPLPSLAEPSLGAAEASALATHPRWLSLKTGGVDTTLPEPRVASDLAARALAPGERGYFLVQIAGPITSELRASLRGCGADVLDYVPNNAFIVRASPRQLAALRALPATLWTGAYHPAYRLEPRLQAASADPALAPVRRNVVVHAFDGVDAAQLEPQIAATGVDLVSSSDACGHWVFVASATPVEARLLAQARDVLWVEPEGTLTPRNNTVQWTVQTFVPNDRRIWDQGLHGEGQVIGHMDGSIALGSCYFDDPEGDPPGPSHRKVAYYSGAGSDAHGTHTAGTAVGDAEPINGSVQNRGIAYKARIAHTSTLAFTTFSSIATTHMNNGARLHSNSWGDDTTTSYNTLCAQIDSFSWNNEDNLVLFSTTNQTALRNPENAKNVLAVGASGNGGQANAHCFGGTGPTADGRRKPEVYTPGCGVVSAAPGACATGNLTGTSMACPSAAAAGALVRQYFGDGFHPTGNRVAQYGFTPSGALIKAVLVNATQDMTGVAGYPSNQEGWGRINLDEALYFTGDATKLLVFDVRRANGLTTGAVASHQVVVTSNNVPLEITLAFQDYPGSLPTSNPVVNDLDLSLTAPNGVTTYLGNVFASGWSATGGVADPLNNVERVAIPSPALGTWIVRVSATNVPQPAQGYALAINGAIDVPGGAGSSLTPYCTTSLTFNLCGPALSATGIASASATSGFVVHATFVEGNRPGTLFYGVNGRAAFPWTPSSTSYLCVQPPLQRTGTQNSGGATGSCQGVLSLDWSEFVFENPGAIGAPFSPGQIVDVQAWFRDPLAPGGSNLSGGLEFTVLP